MMRIGITIIVLLTILGCSSTKTIPAPTQDWTYTKTGFSDAFTDTNYCLLLSLSLEDSGDIGQRILFFKKQLTSEPAPRVHSLVCLADGASPGGGKWSSGGGITADSDKNGVCLHVDEYFHSDELNYSIDEKIVVSYELTGEMSSGKLSCSWEWVELKNRKSWDILCLKLNPDTGSVLAGIVEDEFQKKDK